MKKLTLWVIVALYANAITVGDAAAQSCGHATHRTTSGAILMGGDPLSKFYATMGAPVDVRQYSLYGAHPYDVYIFSESDRHQTYTLQVRVSEFDRRVICVTRYMTRK